MNIIALIPARLGSKGIPDKNIKLYKGEPLLSHSIKVAQQSKYIKDVYVSTDSVIYQEIALKYNAKITPLRPDEISTDLSPDLDTFKFSIDNINPIPDIIVHLRPTYPNRTVQLLDDCIEHFLKHYTLYDSLRTVVPIKKSPIKMYYIEDNNLIPYFKEFQKFKYGDEPYNQARQNFPDTYLHNGCIDIVKTSTILDNNLLSGNTILPYIMDENECNDIDDIEDFINSEKYKI